MNARTVPAADTAERRAPPRRASTPNSSRSTSSSSAISRTSCPLKGARDLENWCRAHPEYLNDLKLPERTQASLKLLEASGQPQDLGEPAAPWWKSPYVPIALAAVAFVSLLAFWALMGKYSLLRGELEDAKARVTPGLAGSAGGVDGAIRLARPRAGHRPCPHRREHRRSSARRSARRHELHQEVDAIQSDRRQGGPGTGADHEQRAQGLQQRDPA